MPLSCPKCGSGKVTKIGAVRRQGKTEIGFKCGYCGKVWQIDQERRMR